LAKLADDLIVFQAKAAEATQPNEIFAALEVFCQSTVGVKLFSCSVFDLEKSIAARVYTNDSNNYPVSGLKDIEANRWTQIVLDRHENFIANSVEEFSDVFPDYAKIASLDLGSVVNIPIMFRGNFIGTVNLLHHTGYYSSDRVALLDSIKLPATVAFMDFETQ
jgi:GAF domain-containing protein